MSSAEQAAKAEGETLAAELAFCASCLAEPAEDSLEILREMLDWQPWLKESLNELEQVGLAVWQGEHTRLFVMPAVAAPFASVQRGGMINGEAAGMAETFYARHGVQFNPGLPGDYLGSLFECLAWLMASDRVREAVSFRENLLDDWLPKYAESVVEQSRLRFYRDLGRRLDEMHQSLKRIHSDERE